MKAVFISFFILLFCGAGFADTIALKSYDEIFSFISQRENMPAGSSLPKLTADSKINTAPPDKSGYGKIIVVEPNYLEGSANSVRDSFGNVNFYIFGFKEPLFYYLGTIGGSRYRAAWKDNNFPTFWACWSCGDTEGIETTYRWDGREYRKRPGVRYEYDKKGKKTRIIGDPLTDTELLYSIYRSFYDNYKQVRGRSVEVRFYKLNSNMMGFVSGKIPPAIAVLKSEGRQTKIALANPGFYRSKQTIEWFIPKTTEPMLAIRNPSGGNGWDANPCYVISLEDTAFLEYAGIVDDARDINSDGTDELIEYEGWEGGLGYLCRAMAPCAITILNVKEGKVVPDIENNISYYKNELSRINKEISAFPKEISKIKDGSDELLSLILQKFLIYRSLNREDEGWKEFNKDIRHYNSNFFYMRPSQRTSGLDIIPIEEIVEKMKQNEKY